MGNFLRRRNLHEENAVDGGLLEQGSILFNRCGIDIEGRTIHVSGLYGSGTDAYDVKRYNNVTDFDANVTTGTDKTEDISNKRSGRVIPAGASCVFAATPHNDWHVSASYQYIAVLLRNTSTGNIKRIGAFGNNVPSSTATWTQNEDVEIGCIAIEYSHWYYRDATQPGRNSGTFDVSLTVNGEEWL